MVDKVEASEDINMLAKVNEDNIADFIEGYTASIPTPAPTPQAITMNPDKQDSKLNSYILNGPLALTAISGGWCSRSPDAGIAEWMLFLRFRELVKRTRIQPALLYYNQSVTGIFGWLLT